MSRIGESWTGDRRRELLIGGAHLGALWAFAFAQPLLDLLGKNPDFFVARSNTPADIVIFALAFTLLPPLAMLAVEAVVAAFSHRAYSMLHLALVALLAAVFFVQVEKRIFTSPAALMIVIALALGAGVAYLLLRERFVRSLLDVLAVAPIVFLAIFIFFSETSKLIFPDSEASALGTEVPSATPVVMVIFDELPTATLLDPERPERIDASRFPNFAALARQSTWYPNNTTVADFTGRAVPAVMTGNNPSGSTLPIAAEQPNSIFSLLGGAYRLHVSEVVTQICAEELCGEVQRPSATSRLRSLVSDLKYVEGRIILPPSLANDLPNVSTTFGDFGNNADPGDKGAGRFAQDLFTPPSPEEFEEFLREIPASDRTLSLIHMELPHEPWRFMPSGQAYMDTGVSNLNTDSAARWAVGSAGIASAQQRHFLQTGYADRLIGLMIERLKRTGIWDRAMVVVTADHGISFQGKAIYRRIAQKENLGGVANPPLFIKYPGQRRGKVSTVLTQTVDIVPTIVRRLGITDAYKMQGRPISEAPREAVVAVNNAQGEVVRLPLSQMISQRLTASGQAGFRLGSGGLFGLGPAPELLGRPAPPLSSGIPTGFAATLEHVSDLEEVDPEAEEVPAFIAGELEGPQPGSLIAITVRGRVAATARAFLDGGTLSYGAVVPPGLLRPGRNPIGIYLAEPGAALVPLGGN